MLSDGRNVAPFSSQGPASGGRLKPDLVAPGHSLVSAASNSPSAFGLTQLSGSYMAAAVAAGSAALVRQYLRDGFFPTGVQGEGDRHFASGALLKAMLIHSAMPLTGVYRGQPLAPPPSDIQGFGRLQLDRILFGPPSSAGGRAPIDRLRFVDWSAPLHTGEEHNYTILVHQSADPLLGAQLKVSLAWVDVAAEVMDTTPLVNDLDLVVVVQGFTYVGNGVTDRVNTVEQVVIDTVPLGVELNVTVRGASVSDGNQTYALVITGALAGPIWSPPPPYPPSPPPPSPPPLSPPPSPPPPPPPSPPPPPPTPPTSPPPLSPSASLSQAVIGIVVAAVAVGLLLLSLGVCLLARHRRGRRNKEEDGIVYRGSTAPPYPPSTVAQASSVVGGETEKV